ncbi:hypothetical protein DFH06DRAFT_1474705 [Mycena polygramma]|nr:hypothetical protein DFH06DRAFT_1474705 [Mycena polygramma]
MRLASEQKEEPPLRSIGLATGNGGIQRLTSACLGVASTTTTSSFTVLLETRTFGAGSLSSRPSPAFSFSPTSTAAGADAGAAPLHAERDFGAAGTAGVATVVLFFPRPAHTGTSTSRAGSGCFFFTALGFTMRAGFPLGGTTASSSASGSPARLRQDGGDIERDLRLCSSRASASGLDGGGGGGGGGFGVDDHLDLLLFFFRGAGAVLRAEGHDAAGTLSSFFLSLSGSTGGFASAAKWVRVQGQGQVQGRVQAWGPSLAICSWLSISTGVDAASRPRRVDVYTTLGLLAFAARTTLGGSRFRGRRLHLGRQIREVESVSDRPKDEAMDLSRFASEQPRPRALLFLLHLMLLAGRFSSNFRGSSSPAPSAFAFPCAPPPTAPSVTRASASPVLPVMATPPFLFAGDVPAAKSPRAPHQSSGRRASMGVAGAASESRTFHGGRRVARDAGSCTSYTALCSCGSGRCAHHATKRPSARRHERRERAGCGGPVFAFSRSRASVLV